MLREFNQCPPLLLVTHSAMTKIYQPLTKKQTSQKEDSYSFKQNKLNWDEWAGAKTVKSEKNKRKKDATGMDNAIIAHALYANETD